MGLPEWLLPPKGPQKGPGRASLQAANRNRSFGTAGNVPVSNRKFHQPSMSRRILRPQEPQRSTTSLHNSPQTRTAFFVDTPRNHHHHSACIAIPSIQQSSSSRDRLLEAPPSPFRSPAFSKQTPLLLSLPLASHSLQAFLPSCHRVSTPAHPETQHRLLPRLILRHPATSV